MTTDLNTTHEDRAKASRTAPTIEPLVHRPLVSVGSKATLRSATRVMRLHEIGAIAVVDEGDLVGVLGEHDVTSAIAAGADPDAALVGAWMARPPVSVRCDAGLVDTAIAMLVNGLRFLPVLAASGERDGYVQLDEILLPRLRAMEGPQERRPYMPPD